MLCPVASARACHGRAKGLNFWECTEAPFALSSVASSVAFRAAAAHDFALPPLQHLEALGLGEVLAPYVLHDDIP